MSLLAKKSDVTTAYLLKKFAKFLVNDENKEKLRMALSEVAVIEESDGVKYIRLKDGAK